MLRPWFVRAVEASPLSPVATGACVAAVLLTANLTAYAGERLDLLLYLPLGIAYLLAASAMSAAACARDLAELRPVFTAPEPEHAALLASTGRYPRTLLWIATGAGLVVSIGLGVSSRTVVESAWTGLLIFGQSLLFWAIAAPVMATLVADAARFRRIGGESLSPPLFEPEALAPFSRVGLRGALVILVVFGVRILFYAIEAPRLLVLANAGPMLVAALLATAALLLPSLGARRSLRATKRRELERVRDALARQPFRPGVTLESGVPAAYLDLLEYRERVANVREWPLDASAIFRFALYLLIPLFGWIGGALMERVLSLVLDR